MKKRRWWIKYLVLFVICLVLSGVSIGIGGENGAFLLILYVLPISGVFVLIFLICDVFRSELFKKFNVKLWWSKYLLLLIPVLGTYLAGWFHKPFSLAYP